jgi:hypothetical protein
MTGVVFSPTVGEYSGAPARIQGQVSADQDTLSFTMDVQSTVTLQWVALGEPLVAARGVEPTWSGGGCVS